MLRAMIAEDAEPVAALIRSAFAAQPVTPDPPMSALRIAAQDIVAHLAADGGGAVVEQDRVITGSALWRETENGLYISRVAVAQTWRRRGIARALLAAAEATARARGLRRLHLSTRLVLTDNRRLFASCGFVETGTTAHPGYTSPTSVDMEKLLV